MRVAVYQRHLATYGGGERYALDWARWFASEGHAVDVLSPPGASLEVAADRLGIDVRGIRHVVLEPFRPEVEASDRSKHYDCFVNVTHGSPAVSLAPRGIYVVHFPAPPPPPAHIVAEAHVLTPGHVSSSAIVVLRGGGLHDSPDGKGWWVAAEGGFGVHRFGDAQWRLRFTLARGSGTWRGAPLIEVRLDDLPLTRIRMPPVGSRTVTVDIPAPRALWDHRVSFAAVQGGAQLERMTGWNLGVLVKRIEMLAPGARTGAGEGRVVGVPHLANYQHVIANSEFTARWIAKRWHLSVPVVYPVVDPIPAAGGAKDRVITVLGRFFSGSHSKRQLELVHEFRRLCDAGLEDWRLELIGGVDTKNPGYFERVRRAAAGYAVELVINASREELVERVGRAALTWQASGWGEDPEAHPERFEHFGIALAESMGAGAVPAANGVGGAAEIVRDGIDGVLWDNSPGPVTLELIADEARRNAMSESAVARARAFDRGAFAARARRAVA